ncbi:lycopene cyclase family protein [Hymenobacter ginsengisoli]|uniref:Lycopene cyclase family protein n=1 Tax=Hymenobacter ginsengisoli TaxID=1051626 RepID=A0ABP8QFL6_9BACT|nr:MULTISPECIES: lycopene cyclase family protein [unclassified Hymenobacter]MBO2030120.1 NAD(P)-binding protein [Hymenobacter sp. BT559]
MPQPSVSALAYDYLLVGGGAAGLSLAYHLAQEPRLAGKRVLLLEPEAKNQNDRTWSYWADEPTPFDSLAAGEWRKIAFRSPGFAQVAELKKYRYRTIRGLDFYQFVQQTLAGLPAQFTVVRAKVVALENTLSGVRARTEAGQEFTAQYAFDSRPPVIEPQPYNYRYLLQHFVGWEIETTRDVFDPEVVEFMDFRGEQHHEARFMYVLPFSARRALVEYTLFSALVLQKADYEGYIAEYLANTLGLAKAEYRIEAEEVGAIPMTDHPLQARVGAHIINVGTRAGRAKPSTGYAFRRIQAQSARLVAALAATGQPPPDATGDQWQFRLFDTLLLDIMQRQGETTRDLFRQLFERNPVQRIFRFLDEKTGWADNLRIMNSVSPGPFMRSIGHVLRGRPGQRQ